MGAKLGKRINPVLNFKSIVLTESIHLLLDCTEEIVPPRIEGCFQISQAAIFLREISQAAIEKISMKKVMLTFLSCHFQSDIGASGF
jgi:hypothetical protein